METFIFALTYLEVKVRSRPGQKRLNRQTQNLFCESCLYCQVLPQDAKNDIYFDVRRIEMPNNCITKMSRFYSETPALKSNSF